MRTRGRRERNESAPSQRLDLATARAYSPRVSGQDLVDVDFRLLPAAGALFVLAREHLADQTEREELEANHDQEHAEREQWPLADRVSERFDDRQIDEDRESD